MCRGCHPLIIVYTRPSPRLFQIRSKALVRGSSACYLCLTRTTSQGNGAGRGRKKNSCGGKELHQDLLAQWILLPEADASSGFIYGLAVNDPSLLVTWPSKEAHGDLDTLGADSEAKQLFQGHAATSCTSDIDGNL